MKKKILIILGGISKERPISLDTGKQVANELKKNGYLVKTCEPNKNLLIVIKDFKPQIIFNALHGQFGEDGYIQSILETIGIPYTHSGVISSAKAMDKEISKKIFTKNKILTPKYFLYSFDKSYKKLLTLINIFVTFYSMWVNLYIKILKCEYNSIYISNKSKLWPVNGYKMFKTRYN